MNIGRVPIDEASELFSNDKIEKMMALLMDDQIKETIKRCVAQKINSVIQEKTQQILKREIEKNIDAAFKTPVGTLCAQYQINQEAIADAILNAYVTVLEENLEKILKAIDVEAIVVEKINSFDAVQLETMVFSVMKRELRAIVYLGVVLGFFMGFINLLF